MDAAGLLRAYDDELRGETEIADADEVTPIGPLWLATFPGRQRGFLTHRPLPPGTDLKPLVEQAVAYFAADERVSHFEWKTRGHDSPNPATVLPTYGFAHEEVETVMAGEISAVVAADPGLPAGHTLHRAGTEAEIREAESLAGAVFGDTPEQCRQQADELAHRFATAPDSFEMWAVRDRAGVVVCSGRVDFVDDTDFATIWGGACAAEHRGRGLYRALTAARARSALARGKRFVQSDCTAYSRPILERAGLLAITTTTPAVWRRTLGPDD
ncbi:GNAT family N-acetyltransferase [Mariniluteicoccus endophyticus]